MFSRIFREFVLQVVVSVGVVAAVTVWALVDKLWTWPNAVVGGTLLLCGVVYLMDRFGFGPTLKTRVRNWLDDSGFGVQTIQDQNEFHFVLIDNLGHRTDVLQLKRNQAITIAMFNLGPSPDQITEFNTFDGSKKAEFWQSVRIELIRRDVAFSDLKLEPPGIFLSDEVPVTRQLTGTELLARMRSVRGTGRLYYEILVEWLGPETRQAASSQPLPVQSSAHTVLESSKSTPDGTSSSISSNDKTEIISQKKAPHIT